MTNGTTEVKCTNHCSSKRSHFAKFSMKLRYCLLRGDSEEGENLAEGCFANSALKKKVKIIYQLKIIHGQLVKASTS